MLEQTSPTELAEWAAWYELEPWGDPLRAEEQRRADIRTGMIIHYLINTHVDDKHQVKLEDCIPQWEKPEEDVTIELTPEMTVAFVANLNAAFGGKDIRTMEVKPDAGPR